MLRQNTSVPRAGPMCTEIKEQRSFPIFSGKNSSGVEFLYVTNSHNLLYKRYILFIFYLF
jgi:hypothetical protein